MSFTIKDKTLFISHTEHSGLRYQNITKTGKSIILLFKNATNKEINTNNKNTIEKVTKSRTTRNTL